MESIAVLSDIHSNHIALRRCLDHIADENIDTFLFLGDYLGELAYPQKTMELIYSIREKYRCFFLRGNKEDRWLAHKENPVGWKEYDSTTGCLYNTYRQLTERDFRFFRSLPIKQEIKIGGLPPLTICHGSPRSVNEKLLPCDENTFSIMKNNPSNLILYGHTHVQGKIEHQEKVALGAGSVGLPLYSSGKSQFMVLRGRQGSWDYELVSLEYDTEKAIEELHSSGLIQKAPSWCKVTEHCLKNGTISHSTVLAKAIAICREKSGECIWPDIPEEYWEQAINLLLE